MIRRRLRLVLAVAAVLTGVAALAISRLPDRYTAEAMVVLNARSSKVAELQSPTESLLSRTQADLSAVRTETEILRSEGLLRAVAERLDLARDSLFSPPDDGPGFLAGLVGSARALLGGLERAAGRVPAAGGPPATAEDPLDRTVERLGRAVTVLNEGGSYALRIQAESKDAGLSARIATALAEVYLDRQRDEQAAVTRQASEWLGKQLEELRAATLRADEAVERHRAQYQLGEADGPSLLDTRITDVNAELIRAGARLGRAEAALAEAEAGQRRGADIAAAGSVLASTTVQALRQNEAELLVRRGTLAQQYGPRHPEVAESDAAIDAVRAKIKLEVERVLAGMRTEVNATRGEVRNLQQQLAGLERLGSAQADVQVRLGGLEREAQANREVYAEYLRQFTATMAQGSGQQPDVRLAAAARPPLEPSGPRRKLLIAGATLGACALGICSALLFGLLRGGINGAEALEVVTGLPTLETVPELRRRALAGLLGRAGPATTNPVQGLAFALHGRLRRPSGGGCVVLVTSSVEGEGKSLLSLLLARALAASGRRTLVLDLDPWRPSLAKLARQLPLKAHGEVTAGLSVSVDGGSGAHIAALDRALPEPSRAGFIRHAVASLDELRQGYDIVLLDGPPVLAIPDVLPAAACADGTLLVVRFEGPDATTVQAALRKLHAVGADLLGTVLSRVDPANHRRYGYGPLSYARRG